MNASFYNGISGVKSHQFGIDVWANNIANIDTVGFIAKTPEFASHFSASLNELSTDPTSNQIGYGSKAQATALNTYREGILTPSDNVFDLAIDGKGWFGVQSLGQETLYTRVGAFSLDSDGYLVDESGNYLLGTNGNNLSKTTLDENTLNAFGKYYRTDKVQDLGTPYSVDQLTNINLNAVNQQSKIFLPDLLYMPPEATTYVNYQANLDPEIKTDITKIELENADITTSNINPYSQTATIMGNVSNTTAIQNPQVGDTVLITLTDASGKSVELNTSLDENLNWSISEADVSALDTLNNITTTAQLQTKQEIANKEHFTTEIISPTGGKNIIDMTFTKQVPQNSLETTWNSEIKILKYHEKYTIETYNPSVTYDPSVYDVNVEDRTVTKIYDPNLYYVDKGSRKVYEIIDSGTGSAKFAGGGELIQSDIPTLSNEGTPLKLNIGTPYQTQTLPVTSISMSGNNLLINGTSTLEKGSPVNINITDPNSNYTITATATVNEDGTWNAIYENPSIIDTSDVNALVTNAYNVIHNGFEGMVSNVNLDKARVAEKDGYVEGFLNRYGMDGNSNIVAEFSNGRSSAIAKVGVYHFVNEQGLASVTNTLFMESTNSGNPMFFTNEDGSSHVGTRVRSNYLEGGNVEYATALTELIIMQKAFDASAKSITTSDQLIQNAINMKG